MARHAATRSNTPIYSITLRIL